MKLFRLGLSAWITLVSVSSFLFGWAVLAHAPKPVQPQSYSAVASQTVLPTLTPLQDLQFGNNSSSQNFQVQSPSSVFSSAPAPLFRTSGS